MLSLTVEQRDQLWRQLTDTVENYIATVARQRVAPDPAFDLEGLRDRIRNMDFSRSLSASDALRWVVDELNGGQVHVAHPRYYGLFNPNPTPMGIAADTIVAAFNPQLAAWSHNPFACEIEQHLVRCFGEKFGYPPGKTEGSFTSGGAEANHTALLSALNYSFPDYARRGARALPGPAVMYVTEESHHSFVKAARLCGIGTDAVLQVPLDNGYRMDVDRLRMQIDEDKGSGRLPFLVVATLGSTNGGLIDPIKLIADVARRESLWLHADAAWGGASVLVPELKPFVDGIERADSITFDAHKWLSVPMGAGMILTRHPGVLEKTFATSTDYMPLSGRGTIVEPHRTTMQWSRRFIGLKVFLSLAVAGWEGYEEAIRHQTAMGHLLREKLKPAGWRVANDTPLPTVCFDDAMSPDKNSGAYLASIVKIVVDGGGAWLSTTNLGGVKPVIRACITNYLTQPDDIEALVAGLGRARERVNI